MVYAEKHIVETYSKIFEKFSYESKKKLISDLSKSLVENKKINLTEKKFFASFGAFASEKSAEEIIEDIKSNRKFIEKDLAF